MQQFIETTQLSPDEITARTREIHARILCESEHLDAGNFTVIHTDDLECLFGLYDRLFFENGCETLLGDGPLFFRLSKRMTRAGGKSGRRELRHRSGRILTTEFEIAVSSTLLFQTFSDEDRPIFVCGIECRDRLEALQRVFEHELIHLIEMLIWAKSSCAGQRFQSIANRFFGHTEHTHKLITPREKAFTKFGIRLGSHVSFRFDGQHYTGIVNRITKRATVLVEDNRGERYSDGKRYAKFYVPVRMLEPVPE